VRQAKRLADALHAPWIALHLERRDGPDVARAALEMAAGLGASVEICAGGSLVAATLELAREKNVTHLVIGRGKPPLLRRLFGRTLASRLVRDGQEFSLHIVPIGSAPRTLRPKRLPRGWLPWAVSTLLVFSAAARFCISGLNTRRSGCCSSPQWLHRRHSGA
jgi:two-component system sensor histidine kinase KdpD